MTNKFKVGDVVIVDQPGAVLNGRYGRIEVIRYFGVKPNVKILYEVSFPGYARPFFYDESQIRLDGPITHIPYHSIGNIVKDMFEIENVIFNFPATIVIWKDGTKTVVKCGDDESYDPEKGLAMAISKKALGNQGNYYEVFKKWLPEEKKEKKHTVIGKVNNIVQNDNGIVISGTITDATVSDVFWKDLILSSDDNE